ncbi:MAG: M50 family metallopeptidase [Microthrixaceae bacterium]
MSSDSPPRPSEVHDAEPVAPVAPHDPELIVEERAAMAGVVGTPAGRALRLALLVGAIVLLGVTNGLSMLIVVAAIVIMIFLHELGHYVMARRAGMLVTEFFIGFGPRIFSFRRGETEYGLKVIPAGAYVKIIGMSNMEEVDPALESQTYRQKSFWQRIGVAVAGSTMHFLIAFVLLFVQFAFIGGPDGDRWTVGAITEGSAADRAGIERGDELLRVDGRPVGGFDDFRDLLADVEPGATQVVVLRDGEQIALPIELATRSKIIGTVGEDVDVIDTGDGLVLGRPDPDGHAATAGLVAGAAVLAVNGEPVSSLDQVADAIGASSDGRFELTVAEDGGDPETRTVELGSALDTTASTAFVGVGQTPVTATRSVPSSAWSAVEMFGSTTKASLVGIGKFIWPPNIVGFVSDTLTNAAPGDRTDTPTPAESTPIGDAANRPISIVGVAMIGSDLSSESLSNLLQFLALLNIFIGVFNLFPMLPFDGGHVVIACYERLQELRRRTGERYLSDVSRLAPVAYAIVLVLLVVGVLAIYTDVTKGVSF